MKALSTFAAVLPSLVVAGTCLSIFACTTVKTETLATDPTLPGSDGGTKDASRDDGGPGSSTDGPTTTACMKTMTAATSRKSKPSRKVESVCTSTEIDGLLAAGDYAEGAAKLSAACRACAVSYENDATWGATVVIGNNSFINNIACIETKGEPRTCTDSIGAFRLCVADACAGCSVGAERDACEKAASADDSACATLAQAGFATCSERLSDNLTLCRGRNAIAAACGDSAVGGCSTLTQQASEVTGVVGVNVPSFTGGAIANGVWVVTKLEGFGPGLGALVVGTKSSTTLSISGSAFEQLAVRTGEPPDPESGTLVVSGNKLTFKRTCPETQDTFQSYTATATTLTVGLGFADDAPTQGIVITYSKK